jgi:hypothetical protein
MRDRGRGQRPLGIAWLSLVPILCASGCLAHLNPAPRVTSADLVSCQALPSASRDSVHVYFINGLDPFDKGNLVGLSERVRELGFKNVEFGQMYDEPAMRHEILQLHREDPATKVVVVGFSFGANLARLLTDQLRAEAIPVDLLVYLGGDTLTNSPEDRPVNARRIVNITAEGCNWLFAGLIWQGVEMDGVENLRLENVDHFHVPTNERVLRLLREDLTVVAGGTPPA